MAPVLDFIGGYLMIRPENGEFELPYDLTFVDKACKLDIHGAVESDAEIVHSAETDTVGA